MIQAAIRLLAPARADVFLTVFSLFPYSLRLQAGARLCKALSSRTRRLDAKVVCAVSGLGNCRAGGPVAHRPRPADAALAQREPSACGGVERSRATGTGSHPDRP